MKVKEYQQMMNYLVRKKDKPIKREETMPERIARLQYTYDNVGTKPKHMDNQNIYTHEQKPYKKKIKKNAGRWMPFIYICRLYRCRLYRCRLYRCRLYGCRLYIIIIIIIY